jgi:hypothetical protein
MKKAPGRWKELSSYRGSVEADRKEGIQRGEVRLLWRQLEHRFGVLPIWAVQKLEAADQATLEEWAMRVLEAKSLEEVFVQSPTDPLMIEIPGVVFLVTTPKR